MQKTSTGVRTGYSSRAERLADGSLVDVSKEARAARFIAHVAMTAGLYDDVQDLSGEYVLSGDTAQSRLQSLLTYARAHAQKHLDERTFSFSLYMPVGDRTTYGVHLSLHAGDNLEDVITLSQEVDHAR